MGPLKANHDARKSVGKHTRELTEALGSTFFDPGNLLCILFLSISALLSISELSSVVFGAAGVASLYYLCLAAFLRNYFFHYYRNRRILLVIFWAVATGFILVGAWYWNDCSQGFNYALDGGIATKSHSDLFAWAAILHVMSAATLTIHFLVPRRWLIRMADDLSDNFQEVVADEGEEIQS